MLCELQSPFFCVTRAIFMAACFLTFISKLYSTDPIAARTDSVASQLVLIPAGEFQMGLERSVADEVKVYGERASEFGGELPRHRVRISRAFYLSKHEVTVGQFAKFVAATAYRTVAETNGTGSGLQIENGRVVGADAPGVTLYSPFQTGAQYHWRNTGLPQSDDHPVVNVTPADAEEYCRWLSKVEKVTYRLPSEAEWEYACRAGTTTRYANSDEPSDVTKIGNIADQSGAKMFPHWTKKVVATDDGFAFTAPVSSFPANAWGLHDMHGNVWEWCSDSAFRKYPKTSETIVDPVFKDTDEFRIVRGGCWTKWTTHCRSSKRYRNPSDKPSLNVGFRIVREIPEVR
ncbi:MAG: formylglycine-generating enzyme family protein [Pirellulaceae bacterium]|nr:formylglycine-generating enzyme family protein [Pirellulaceae bacterium]